MDQPLAARLELTCARARALLGAGVISAGGRARTESTSGSARAPGDADTNLIAACIDSRSSTGTAVARAIAADLVDRARAALAKIHEGSGDGALEQFELLALESVIHVRGRPALRVLGARLESLANFPGSEFWQEIISDYEERIVAAAAVTGAVVVSAFSTGNPPWTQGSAWLSTPIRVVTNRHVLLPPEGIKLIEDSGSAAPSLRPGFNLIMEFAADDRSPSKKIRRRVTQVLYVAKATDPVDIAVLAIEPYEDQPPLVMAQAAAEPPKNLFVVGHPGLMSSVPDEVKAVFGNPDGRKRVSFGKLLQVMTCGNLVHDASTVGGYSGGPVVGTGKSSVAGLHYFGDPANGNLAVSADAIRAHPAYGHFAEAL